MDPTDPNPDESLCQNKKSQSEFVSERTLTPSDGGHDILKISELPFLRPNSTNSK
jgi:hypothetical protein